MKRITFFCLMLLLLGGCGCATQSLPNTGETSTEGQTEPVYDLEHLREHLDEYAIVYSCKTDQWNADIQGLVDDIKAAYNITIPVFDDANAYFGAPIEGIEGKRLILIGNVRHDIVKSYAETLSSDSFLLTADETGNVVALGSNDVYTTLALESLRVYLHNDHTVEWQLNVPEYIGGVRAQNVYNAGDGKDMGADLDACRMQLITRTNREQFDAYLVTLKQAGYTEIARNEEFENVYVQYYHTTEQRLVYTYYIDALGDVRVIEDGASVPETAFEYSCPDGDITVYQYAMMYNRKGYVGDPGDPGDSYASNGMFYIIRLADNRLILIDGGDPRQTTDAATDELYRFMQEITNTKDHERINIACWFLTYQHPDNYSFIQQFMNRYTMDQINIERVMYNIPNGWCAHLGDQILSHYPDAKFIKPHTGQRITLGNIDLEVMFTHEDYVDRVSGTSMITESNNESTVLRLHMNGRTMIVAGDWGGAGRNDWGPTEYISGITRMLAMHTTENGGNSLHSDILQVSHHGMNPFMPQFNKAVAAEYVFIPTTDVMLSVHAVIGTVTANIEQVTEAGCDPERIYFASRYTYCLHIDPNGIITVGAETIRGSDTGDNPDTEMVEQDYLNVTLKAYDAYRIPTKEEFENWYTIHN